MPRATTKQTVETELKLKPAVETKLRKELRAYASVHRELVALKEAEAGHRDNVLAMHDDIGAKSFRLDDVAVSLTFDAENKKLDRTKVTKWLVRHGISAAQVDEMYNACTTRTPKKPYATIRLPGEKESDD